MNNPFHKLKADFWGVRAVDKLRADGCVWRCHTYHQLDTVEMVFAFHRAFCGPCLHVFYWPSTNPHIFLLVKGGTNQQMLVYCTLDVRVTLPLLPHTGTEGTSQEA